MTQTSHSMVMQPIEGAYPSALLVPAGSFAHLPPVSIGRPLTLIGSSDQVHVRLRTQTVSPLHAIILNSNGRVLLRNAASKKHIYVNRQPVLEKVLNAGDEVRIGKIRFTFVPGENAFESGRVPLSRIRFRYADGMPRVAAQPLIIIGRWRHADIVVDADGIADVHAVAFKLGPHLFARDLSQSALTSVNGQEIVQAQLFPGDVVEIGGKEIRFEVDREASEPVAAAALGMPDTSFVSNEHGNPQLLDPLLIVESMVSSTARRLEEPEPDLEIEYPVVAKTAEVHPSQDQVHQEIADQSSAESAAAVEEIRTKPTRHAPTDEVANESVPSQSQFKLSSPIRRDPEKPRLAESRIASWGPLAVALAAREKPELLEHPEELAGRVCGPAEWVALLLAIVGLAVGACLILRGHI